MVRNDKAQNFFPGDNGDPACRYLRRYFVGCYGFFLNSTNNTAADSFLEQESIINSLYEANQVLHRDLYNLENSASLSYLQLYYPCTPAMKAAIAASDPSYYKETISSSEASIDTSPDAGDTSLASSGQSLCCR